jgi:hypothetical protein
MQKIFYLSEISLPNTSAQVIQILKMCDSFSNKKKEVYLLVNHNETLKFFDLKKKYNLKTNFKIISLENNKNLNFLRRINLANKAIRYISLFKDNNKIVISRSIISSIIFSIFGKKNILELHSENSGISRILFNFFRKTSAFKNQFFILIHKNLNKHFKFDKKKFIILDDAVDIEDFKFKKKIKKIKNSCVYTGSFYKGKGVEFIFELSKILPKVKFYLYGDINTLDGRFKNNKQNKNLIFRNHIEYSQIPKTLAKFEIILMPYSKKVYVKSKSIEVGQYMSPLKLFDYLASGKILIASEHENYKHILIDKINCFSLHLNKINLWKNKIEDIFLYNNNKLIKNIKSKARATAKKYTWKKRTTKIINFINGNKIYD